MDLLRLLAKSGVSCQMFFFSVPTVFPAPGSQLPSRFAIAVVKLGSRSEPRLVIDWAGSNLLLRALMLPPPT